MLLRTTTRLLTRAAVSSQKSSSFLLPLAYGSSFFKSPYTQFSLSRNFSTLQEDVTTNTENAEDTLQKVENGIENFGIRPNTVAHLKSLGYETLFPIQAATFAPILEGKDLIARDQTGSGKTLSYALPLCERFRRDGLFANKNGQKPLALVVVPTRELVTQVTNVLNKLKLDDNEFRVLNLYGGTDIMPQMDKARRGTEFVVSTPGRLIDMMERGGIDMSLLQTVVLDEADMMLDMGFQEDIERIYEKVKQMQTESELQTMLLSATLPPWVHDVSKKYLRKDIVKIDLLKNRKLNTPSTVKHLAMRCSFQDRDSAIGDIVLCYGGQHARTIIFTETKKEANDIMMKANIRQECQVLHGDIPQQQREVTFKAFREGKFQVLIATNVAARGLDIPEIDLVIQLDPPTDVETYIHRAGRTARAGKSGVCVTFYSNKNNDQLEKIETKAKFKFQKIGAPQPADIIKASGRDIATSVKQVPHEVVAMFKEISDELVKDLGAEEALCRALAIITGTTEKFKQRSLITSNEGMVTYIIEAEGEFRNSSQVRDVLKDVLPKQIAENIRTLKLFANRSGAAFDIASTEEEALSKAIKENTSEDIVLKKAQALPELEENFNEAYNNRMNNRDRSSGRFDNRDRHGRDNRELGYGSNKGGFRREERGMGSRGGRRDDQNKVFVGGLPHNADEETLREFFDSEGFTTHRIHILKDEEGASKGVAFVTLSSVNEVEEAIRLSGSKIDSRSIKIARVNQS